MYHYLEELERRPKARNHFFCLKNRFIQAVYDTHHFVRDPNLWKLVLSVDDWAVLCAIFPRLIAIHGYWCPWITGQFHVPFLPVSSRGAAPTNLWGISMDCPTSLHESPTNSIDGGAQIKNPSWAKEKGEGFSCIGVLKGQALGADFPFGPTRHHDMSMTKYFCWTTFGLGKVAKKKKEKSSQNMLRDAVKTFLPLFFSEVTSTVKEDFFLTQILLIFVFFSILWRA